MSKFISDNYQNYLVSSLQEISSKNASEYLPSIGTKADFKDEFDLFNKQFNAIQEYIKNILHINFIVTWLRDGACLNLMRMTFLSLLYTWATQGLYSKQITIH